MGALERTHHEDLMSEAERNLARAMLLAAGYAQQDVEWMAASCPSLERCREVCIERRRTPLETAVRQAAAEASKAYAVEIHDAHKAYRIAMDAEPPDHAATSAAWSALLVVVLNVQERERSRKAGV